MVAFTHGEFGGGSRCDFRFRGPGVTGEPIIEPTDANQLGMWEYDTELNLGVTNTGATNVQAFLADLNGTLFAEHAVYDVWVYWSTTDGTNNIASWLADGGSFYFGSFTNVYSTNLTRQVTGLAEDTTYYYRFYGSNAATTVWAAPSATFSTVNIPDGTLFRLR